MAQFRGEGESRGVDFVDTRICKELLAVGVGMDLEIGASSLDIHIFNWVRVSTFSMRSADD